MHDGGRPTPHASKPRQVLGSPPTCSRGTCCQLGIALLQRQKGPALLMEKLLFPPLRLWGKQDATETHVIISVIGPLLDSGLTAEPGGLRLRR